HPAIAPRGRLEQSLIDLGVRDTGLLRQGAGVDQMAHRLLAQAYRCGLASPQPDAGAAPEPNPANAAVDAVRAAEAMIHEAQTGPSLEPSWRAGEAECPSVVAEPSRDAPEIGDEEPELEL